jgi:glyoxylate reductase
VRVRVVSTTSLPIDLAAQLRARLPDVAVDVPARGHVAVGGLDLTDAAALVCLLVDRIDAAVLARAPTLKIVANCAVGVDNIDLVAAARAGVAVTNTPDVLTEATAEFAFALMLAAARRLPEGERLVRGGTWTGWALDQLLGVQLVGKTLGIVGFGRIGRALARRAEAFGMRIIYSDVHGGVSIASPADAGRAAPPQAVRRSIDALFAEADVVSLHCPLTPETRHVVNARTLARMKPTGIVVNTARGGCVDESALIEALTAGRLFAAGLDVYANEPEIDPRLVACPRVVLAPHIGSATTETRTQMAQLCADAVIAILTGRRPGNLVEAPRG